MMTKDQYANYVVQKMLEVSTCWHAVLCCGLNHCVSMLCCGVTHCASMLCCGVPGCVSMLCCGVTHCVSMQAASNITAPHRMCLVLIVSMSYKIVVYLTVSVCSQLQSCSVLFVSAYSQHSVKHHMVCLTAHLKNCLNGNLTFAWSCCYTGSHPCMVRKLGSVVLSHVWSRSNTALHVLCCCICSLKFGHALLILVLPKEVYLLTTVVLEKHSCNSFLICACLACAGV